MHGFDKDKIQKIIDLSFDLDIYYDLKINILRCNTNIDREQKTFLQLQKYRGKMCA